MESGLAVCIELARTVHRVLLPVNRSLGSGGHNEAVLLGILCRHYPSAQTIHAGLQRAAQVNQCPQVELGKELQESLPSSSTRRMWGKFVAETFNCLPDRPRAEPIEKQPLLPRSRGMTLYWKL